MTLKKNRILCFLIDYGVYWDCNIACSYCRDSPIRSNKEFKTEQIKLETYINGLDKVSYYADAVMFKTSGWGEITQITNYVKIFQHARAVGYEVLQLITNGVNIFTKFELEELKNLGYFSLQMSIDGLSDSDNIYRFNNSKSLLNRVLNNLELALSMGIPVEINTVLTDANTGGLSPFLNELLRLRDKYNTPVICVPRRVRVKNTLKNYDQIPSESMIKKLEELVIGCYSNYSAILPPKAYLIALVHNLYNEERSWKVYDSLIRINIGASGDIVIHTNSGNKDIGNVFGSNCAEAFENRKYYHSFIGDDNYQSKMTQFDIHYLYLDGKLSLSDMSKIPSCDNPIAKARLQQLQDMVSSANNLTTFSPN
ncbi:MAG: radical SAM protein [Methylobacter sp.]